MNNFIKYALIRAARSFVQALASTLPAGIAVTPVMLQTLDLDFIYIVLAWLATALLHSLAAFLSAVVTGLPEVEYKQYLYDELEGEEDPDDDEIEEEYHDD